MRIYLAGLAQTGFSSAEGGSKSEQVLISEETRRAYPYDLESYHYIRDMPKVMPYFRGMKKTIFLDSGAFSMFTQKIRVELSEYATYIKEHQDVIHVASNLDEIGRAKEEESYRNQKSLERMGVEVMPVHHARDDDKWLQKYLAEGYDYIFLGGMVAESRKWLLGWLDHVFARYLTKKDGTAKVKVHGFGLTTIDLMSRYPWYSVDSTAWVMASRFGLIFVTVNGRDKKIFISDQSPTRKDWDRHYDTMDPVTRSAVDEHIEAMGYDPAALRTSYGTRDKFNIDFFRRYMDRQEPTFKLKHQPKVSLF
jgi:hypothetical protein